MRNITVFFFAMLTSTLFSSLFSAMKPPKKKQRINEKQVLRSQPDTLPDKHLQQENSEINMLARQEIFEYCHRKPNRSIQALLPINFGRHVLSRNNKYLILEGPLCDMKLYLLNLFSEELWTLPLDEFIEDIAIDPTSNNLFFTTTNGRRYIYNLEEKRYIAENKLDFIPFAYQQALSSINDYHYEFISNSTGNQNIKFITHIVRCQGYNNFTNKEKLSSIEHPECLISCCLTPDNNKIIMVTTSSLYIFDINTKTYESVFITNGKIAIISEIIPLPDNQRILIGINTYEKNLSYLQIYSYQSKDLSPQKLLSIHRLDQLSISSSGSCAISVRSERASFFTPIDSFFSQEITQKNSTVEGKQLFRFIPLHNSSNDFIEIYQSLENPHCEQTEYSIKLYSSIYNTA